MIAERARGAPLLIFDLDGTLYRTESSFVRTMQGVYSEHGLTYPGDAAVLRLVGVPFEEYIDWLVAQGFTDGREQLQAEIAHKELEAIREHGRLYDGVATTLRELARRGWTFALCTNGDRRYVDAVLKRCQIHDLFARLSTIDGGVSSKAERVAALLSALRPRIALVIGDRIHDVQAGRANGCRVIGALYGFGGNGELDAADATMAAFPDLLALVEGLAA